MLSKELCLNWIDKKVKRLKDKEYAVVLREIHCFGLQFTAFFSTCHELKTWFRLCRVKLYRNDLKGNKKQLLSSYQEVQVIKGSSYQG